MKRRWRFLIWLTVLSGVWVFANLPRDGGYLLPFLKWAGFPWTFAHWKDDRLETYDQGALIADIALGIVIVIPLAGLCALSRGTIFRTGKQMTPIK